jgi:hypothetical protein
MHMWLHVTNQLITSSDKDSNSETNKKLRIHDSWKMQVECVWEANPSLRSQGTQEHQRQEPPAAL